MSTSNRRPETAVGGACLLLGVALAVGAAAIPSDAGYAGVGPNFLPWVVAFILMACGAGLIWQATHGGFHARGEPEGAAHADWPAFAWVSAAILFNAASITTIGFILSCTVAFVLAVRGYHHAQGRLDLSAGAWARDIGIGFAISAPVFWLFTLVLGINLPGLTGSGWL